MKARNFALQAALVLIFLGPAVPLHAQGDVWVGSDLSICNKGTVPVEVVAANQRSGLVNTWWSITGVTKAPGECAIVTNQDEDPSYIAFGLSNAKGGMESGTAAQVPDIGSVPRNLITILGPEEKVLIGAAKGICARIGVTRYSMNNDFTKDCSTLTMSGLGPEYGQGPFLPLTSALFFHPAPHNCRGLPVWVACENNHYYVNIYPGATGRELHATAGTKSGVDAALEEASDREAASQVLKAIAKAMADEREKQAKAAADAAAAKERQLREQAAARQEKQKQILAADAAGNPNVKVEAQMIRRDEADNQQRWAGTRQSPSAYDPQWMGQNIVITGTVSRVEVDTKGSPRWVTIYFRESPDATFVACSPYADLFQERVGLNLSAMVGKTLETAGPVESPMCGPKASKGSIRVVESRQWQIR
ncbi:MAG: hypothetical protein LAO79_13695 [Acidobacteriia bacterium]|nr:hypothetical protein [Terriglobia bacterium]